MPQTVVEDHRLAQEEKDSAVLRGESQQGGGEIPRQVKAV